MLKIQQTRHFSKIYKKLHKNQLLAVNSAISDIVQNPLIGEKKKGDLSDVYVYKFSMLGQMTLLGYSYLEEELTILLLNVSSHENFYRDLKLNS